MVTSHWLAGQPLFCSYADWLKMLVGSDKAYRRAVWQFLSHSKPSERDQCSKIEFSLSYLRNFHYNILDMGQSKTLQCSIQKNYITEKRVFELVDIC